MPKKQILSILILLFIAFSLPFQAELVKTARKFITQALGKNAQIEIDPQDETGILPFSWQAFGQGGEENSPQTLSSAVSKMKTLSPKLVRVDHVFDYYTDLQFNENRLIADFTKLDSLINDILSMGAKPFISISYMHPGLSSGDVVSTPASWENWQSLVRQLVEHLSGKGNRNIPGVYYEVWNEPDLFGKYSADSYFTLYANTMAGISSARNVNNFKVGGPAITHLNKGWINKFLSLVNQQNTRLDFLSWHRYSEDPEVFFNDLSNAQNLLSQYPALATAGRLITEWGSDSENSPNHDANFDAAHTVAVLRRIIDKGDWFFTFEIKDGKSPEDKEYWGRWGILTWEGKEKPRFNALRLLKNLDGQTRISLSGEGTWVGGIATKNQDHINILLYNYDQFGNHAEATPIKIKNLADGEWAIKWEGIGIISGNTTVQTVNGELALEMFLPTHSVVLITAKPL